MKDNSGSIEVGGYVWRLIQTVIDTTDTGGKKIHISDCIRKYDKAHPLEKVRFCGYGHERLVEYTDVLKAVSFVLSKSEIEIHKIVFDRFAKLKYEWSDKK